MKQSFTGGYGKPSTGISPLKSNSDSNYKIHFIHSLKASKATQGIFHDDRQYIYRKSLQTKMRTRMFNLDCAHTWRGREAVSGSRAPEVLLLLVRTSLILYVFLQGEHFQREMESGGTNII